MLAVHLRLAGSAAMSAYCGAPDCTSESPHVHCASCGAGNPNMAGICPHHSVYEDDWAAANRIWCDGIHRQRWAARLPAQDREAVETWVA